jgi:hypothetical protein
VHLTWIRRLSILALDPTTGICLPPRYFCIFLLKKGFHEYLHGCFQALECCVVSSVLLSGLLSKLCEESYLPRSRLRDNILYALPPGIGLLSRHCGEAHFSSSSLLGSDCSSGSVESLTYRLRRIKIIQNCPRQ